MIQYHLTYKKEEDLGIYSTKDDTVEAAKVHAERRYHIRFKSTDSFCRHIISNAYYVHEIDIPDQPKKPKPERKKEFLYVGHYIDTKGRYILKIGTTNDLDRRRKQHTINYRKVKKYTMPPNDEFVYDWYIKLSKYNTLRFEDLNRKKWQQIGIGEFVRNDRFACAEKPQKVEVTIRKTYVITL